jgi:hypothetical protein
MSFEHDQDVIAVYFLDVRPDQLEVYLDQSFWRTRRLGSMP